MGRKRAATTLVKLCCSDVQSTPQQQHPLQHQLQNTAIETSSSSASSKGTIGGMRLIDRHQLNPATSSPRLTKPHTMIFTPVHSY